MQRIIATILAALFPLALFADAQDKKTSTLGAAVSNPLAGPPQVVLTWTVSNSTGTAAATSQQIFRGTTPGGENYQTPIKTINDNVTATYTDADPALVRGQTYYYTIKAFNAGGGSPASNEAIAAIPNPPVPPNAPTNLSGTPQ